MRRLIIGLAIALLLAVATLFVGGYLRFLLGQLAVAVIAVASLSLLGNMAGMISLASAAFMGFGGYGALILLTMMGMPLVFAIPLTLAAGWVVGWGMGLVAIRLHGISLAIVTFGFIQIFQVFAKQGGELSGDGYGLVVPDIVVPGLGHMTQDHVAAACVFAAAMTVVLTANLTKSRIGRTWLAIKENPIAAQMQGVNLLMVRSMAFATAGAMAALAGILQALLLGITNPNLYTIDTSISHLAMMVVGGSTGMSLGAVLGPALLFFLPEYFDLGAYHEVLFGGALLITLVIAPTGLVGVWERLAALVTGRKQ